MRVGIIGAGNIGRVHARAVLASADDGVSLAGLFDVDQGRADTLAADLGTRAFASLGELHEAADGIVVASPNRTHAAYACEALAQGRHVLCEKPMATSLAEAADMLRLSSGAAGVSCVGFNYRYLPVVREIHAADRGGGDRPRAPCGRRPPAFQRGDPGPLHLAGRPDRAVDQRRAR